MKASQIYLEETALFLLLSKHPDREALLQLLEEHLQKRGSLCTSVLALQNMLELTGKLFPENVPEDLQFYWKEWEDLFEEILPIDYKDLQLALELQRKYKISLKESLHPALTSRYGIETMIAPSQPYSRIASLNLIPLESIKKTP